MEERKVRSHPASPPANATVFVHGQQQPLLEKGGHASVTLSAGAVCIAKAVGSMLSPAQQFDENNHFQGLKDARALSSISFLILG